MKFDLILFYWMDCLQYFWKFFFKQNNASFQAKDVHWLLEYSKNFIAKRFIFVIIDLFRKDIFKFPVFVTLHRNFPKFLGSHIWVGCCRIPSPIQLFSIWILLPIHPTLLHLLHENSMVNFDYMIDYMNVPVFSFLLISWLLIKNFARIWNKLNHRIPYHGKFLIQLVSVSIIIFTK